MRYQIRATIAVEDADAADLIAVAKERCETQGGSPEMLTDVGAALAEIFDMTDYQGNPPGGFTLTDLEVVELCASCNRRVHR